MYHNKKFTSDLINSYAWDTALVFLQTFDDRTNKVTPYSRQTTLNSSLALKGTNSLDTTKQDKICNIWDMASNGLEWSTETSTYTNAPSAVRGGSYYYSHFYSDNRGSSNSQNGYETITFRTLLYF